MFFMLVVTYDKPNYFISYFFYCTLFLRYVAELQQESVIMLFHSDINEMYVPLGPVMTKFTIALREIGTYKEVLRSQVKYFLTF